MIEWSETLRSSNIARVGYDPDAQATIVEFKSGARYAYDGMSREEALALAGDSSPGGYFARHVRNRYKTRKL